MKTNNKLQTTNYKKKTKSTIPRRHRMTEPVWRSEAPRKSSSKLYNFDKRYYFNLKAHRWKRHIDGDWDNGPIISRVPLEPEQAVLSCCSARTVGVRIDTRIDSNCIENPFPVGPTCNVGGSAKLTQCDTNGGGVADPGDNSNNLS